MDRAVVVDVETTGLNPSKDAVLEVALLEFGWTPPSPPVILRTLSMLGQPPEAIPEKVVALTGITDDAVRGLTIDWQAAAGILSDASLVIAHNADFDRAFLDNVPAIRDLRLRWACSMRHVDWMKKGFSTRALTYLAADHGWVNPFPHRALFDCATTFRLISPHLEELCRRSTEREYIFLAHGSAFESKDTLKAHGYRWESSIRVWCKEVFESDLGAEREFLATHIYGKVTRHEEVPRDVFLAKSKVSPQQ